MKIIHNYAKQNKRASKTLNAILWTGSEHCGVEDVADYYTLAYFAEIV